MEGRGEEKVGKGEVRKKEQRWEEKERGREVGDAKEVNLEGEVLLSFGESDLGSLELWGKRSQERKTCPRRAGAPGLPSP